VLLPDQEPQLGQQIGRHAHDQQQELALVSEVAVEGAGVDAGVGGDEIDFGPGKAVLVEDREGSRDRALSLASAALLARDPRDIKGRQDLVDPAKSGESVGVQESREDGMANVRATFRRPEPQLPRRELVGGACNIEEVDDRCT
jgi:hypothetical protein